MNKSDAQKALTEKGYKANIEDGVLMIEVASEVERSRANKAVRELGLRGSWGTRGVRTNEDNRG